MTATDHPRLSRNLAEVIDDLYAAHAPPRDHDRLLELVEQQVRRVMWLAEKPLRAELRALEEYARRRRRAAP